LYVSISLQKIDQIIDAKQKILLLRDLSNLNQNETYVPIINEMVEDSYVSIIQTIRESNELRSIINEIASILQSHNRVNDAIIDLFDMQQFASNDIIEVIKCVIQKWNLSEESIQKLNVPQITAISSIVISYLQQNEINVAIQYIDNVIRDFPNLNSNSFGSLMIDVILQIFRTQRTDIRQNFTTNHFFAIFDRLREIENIDERTTDSFIALSSDVKFISFLNARIGEFLRGLMNWNAIKPPKKYQVIGAMSKLVSISAFHDALPSINKEFFEFSKQYREVGLQFVSKFFEIFAQSRDQLLSNFHLLRESNELSKEIKSWLDTSKFALPFVMHIKQSIKTLLESWYLVGELPAHGFDLHKDIVNTWSDFVGLQRHTDTMVSTLHLKDFIASCQANDLDEIQRKYQTLPVSVFQLNLSNLLQDMISMINGYATNSNEFSKVHQLFIYFQNDYTTFGFNINTFEEIVSKFIRYVENTINYAIAEGDNDLFKQIFKDINGDLIYIPRMTLENIKTYLTSQREINIEQLNLYKKRIEQMQYYFESVEKLIKKYDEYMNLRYEFMNPSSFLSIETLRELVTTKTETAKQMLNTFMQHILDVADQSYFDSN
jgi:hypothetical protein